MARRYLNVGDVMQVSCNGRNAAGGSSTTPAPAWRVSPDGVLSPGLVSSDGSGYFTVVGPGRCQLIAYTNVTTDAGTGASALIEGEPLDVEVMPVAANPADSVRLIASGSE